MNNLARRIARLERTIELADGCGSFMARYNEIHRLALARLTAAERSLWQQWAALRTGAGSWALTDDHKAAGVRWVAAFDAVAKEMAVPFPICAYDQWL